jgi:hypothetical protein
MNIYSLEENGLSEVLTVPFANEKEMQKKCFVYPVSNI